jgi:hypothetical protein
MPSNQPVPPLPGIPHDDAEALAAQGPIERLLSEEHRALEALLDASVADPARFDVESFERFRSGLLRHIGIEEKIVLKDAQKRRGGVALPEARTLRIEHGAIASLLVPTPDVALVHEIRKLLAIHDKREEGPAGIYATCDRLAGDEAGSLCERARAAPSVPAAAHFDGPGTYRRAVDALRASRRSRPPRASRPRST